MRRLVPSNKVIKSRGMIAYDVRGMIRPPFFPQVRRHVPPSSVGVRVAQLVEEGLSSSEQSKRMILERTMRPWRSLTYDAQESSSSSLSGFPGAAFEGIEMSVWWREKVAMRASRGSGQC